MRPGCGQGGGCDISVLFAVTFLEVRKSKRWQTPLCPAGVSRDPGVSAETVAVPRGAFWVNLLK